MTWPHLGSSPLSSRSFTRISPADRAQEKPSDPSRLTVQRIFGTHEFEPEHVAVRWLRGRGYTTLEPSKDDLRRPRPRRHDPATGKREILVSAAHLIPPREVGAAARRRLCALRRIDRGC